MSGVRFEHVSEGYRCSSESWLSYLAPEGDLAVVTDLETPRTVVVEMPSPEFLVRLSVRSPLPRGSGEVVERTPGEGPLAPGSLRFPYGPVSYGLFEAGRIDLESPGEKVRQVVARTGYKRRHIDRSVVGLPPTEALPWIERWAGPFSVAHGMTFLAACESALELSVPSREGTLRALGAELQRIHHHLTQIARVVEAAAQSVGTAQFAALAEEVRRWMGRLGGHRYLFGFLDSRNPYRRLDEADRRALVAGLREIRRRFDVLWGLTLETRILVDRIQCTATLSRSEAIAGGAVGPVQRASGVAWDDRQGAAVPPYDDLLVSAATEQEGDALARLLVRAAEIRRSVEIIEELVTRWPGPLESFDPRPPVAPSRGLARSESPAGDLVYDVTLSEGRIQRIGVRTASEANWPVFARSLRGSVFTDFHFAWESFGLSFADTDG